MLPEPKISYKPFWGICRPLNSWRANSPNPIQIYCAQSLTNGGLSRNRTNDTRIFSPLLYQLSYETTWLREKDLNQRPPGYEPDELPDCSIPRCELIKMAQKLGFEPRRRSHDLPVFKTGPFSHLGTSAYV